MSMMRRPTQGVVFPRMKELEGIVNPCGCGDIRGRSGVDGGTMVGIGGGNGDGDA